MVIHLNVNEFIKQSSATVSCVHNTDRLGVWVSETVTTTSNLDSNLTAEQWCRSAVSRRANCSIRTTAAALGIEVNEQAMCALERLPDAVVNV